MNPRIQFNTSGRTPREQTVVDVTEDMTILCRPLPPSKTPRC
jgi:hypothetical protein